MATQLDLFPSFNSDKLTPEDVVPGFYQCHTAYKNEKGSYEHNKGFVFQLIEVRESSSGGKYVIARTGKGFIYHAEFQFQDVLNNFRRILMGLKEAPISKQ